MSSVCVCACVRAGVCLRARIFCVCGCLHACLLALRFFSFLATSSLLPTTPGLHTPWVFCFVEVPIGWWGGKWRSAHAIVLREHLFWGPEYATLNPPPPPQSLLADLMCVCVSPVFMFVCGVWCVARLRGLRAVAGLGLGL
jgi:hypothetical protein